MIFGLVTNDPVDALIRTWQATDNPEDMLKPDSRFIPCADIHTGIDKLRRLNPTPEWNSGCFEGHLVRVSQNRNHTARISVAKYPVLYGNSWYPGRFGDDAGRELVDAVTTHGRLMLVNHDTSYSLFGVSSASGANFYYAVREQTWYRRSRLLVTAAGSTPGAYILSVDPEAPARKLKIFAQTEKARKARRAREAEKRKKEEEKHALTIAISTAYRKLAGAADSLLSGLPGCGPLTSGWRYGPLKYMDPPKQELHFVHFKIVVGVHEKLVGPGKWARNKHVRTAAAELAAVRDHLEVSSPKARAAFKWFWDHVRVPKRRGAHNETKKVRS